MAAGSKRRPTLATLPDYLLARPRLLIVGLNPGAYSVKVGHYYGRKSNRFWALLSQSGLVPEPLGCEDDHRLPSFGIAITDLVKRCTPNIDTLSLEEFRLGAKRLRKLVLELEPAVVAFNGLAGYRAAFDRKARIGLQANSLEGSDVFVVASTSPRTGATFSFDEQLEQWRGLCRAVESASALASNQLKQS